jgi:hypothetical protein
MTSALSFKELRESLGIALLGLAALLSVALANMGWSPLPGVLNVRGVGIPFISDGFLYQFGLVAGGLALALGMRQSIGDFWGEAHLFLLTRPVSRARIYGTKLAIGLGIYLLCGALPILLYGWWAAIPGTHASPFDWTMTTDAWMTWLAMTAVYLGAMLSGIRPAAWFGTRLAPVVAGVNVACFVVVQTGLIGLLVLAATDALLLVSILHVVNRRDFA